MSTSSCVVDNFSRRSTEESAASSAVVLLIHFVMENTLPQTQYVLPNIDVIIIQITFRAGVRPWSTTINLLTDVSTPPMEAVSYTHLDVYKRQHGAREWLSDVGRKFCSKL